MMSPQAKYSPFGAIAQWLEQRTHNPLVAGSSPACPTFSTSILKLVFVYYAVNAEILFYANFTHSTKRECSNWQQKLANRLVIFSFHSTSLNPLDFYQIFIQVRKKCVKLCLFVPHITESKSFVYVKTRDLLSLVLKYFLLC